MKDNQTRETESLPRHVAIIMDGNGRWAKSRGMKRYKGHHEGVKSVREIVSVSRRLGIESVTIFAFSSENWRRPSEEVNMLMELFLLVLNREVKKLHRNGIRLQIIGNRSRFSAKILKALEKAEKLTAENREMNLFVAADYGGKWDITNAVNSLVQEHISFGNSEISFTEEQIASRLSIAGYSDPDLFIRTGGEKRISNYLIWQLAYAELYFTDVLWPDFREDEYMQAIQWYSGRQRRFGMTGDQITEQNNP
ncbi:MAG: di-trans,poly-cis-decaprenylcistransferase [Gammaproteobacteria bacterium]|nr:MAG: di-trans,poly-cis-decaprenylcistransferase [Gammaproteobacteria bacterium]